MIIDLLKKSIINPASIKYGFMVKIILYLRKGEYCYGKICMYSMWLCL